MSHSDGFLMGTVSTSRNSDINVTSIVTHKTSQGLDVQQKVNSKLEVNRIV